MLLRAANHFYDKYSILLTETTSEQNEVALNNHKLRELQFLAVVFAVTIVDINALITVTPQKHLPEHDYPSRL